MKTNIIKPILFCFLSISVLAGCKHNDKEPEVNTAPQFLGSELSTSTDTPIDSQFAVTDENNDPLTFKLVSEPMIGMVTVTTKGAFVYTPPFEQTGEDSFIVSVDDGTNDPVEQVITVKINALEVMFSSISRNAFTQESNATPLSINGRVIEDDVTTDTFYDDLLAQ